MTTLVIDESSLRAIRAQVTEEALVVDLADGRSVSVPLGWYPRLLQASGEERRRFRLIGSGDGLYWELLDEGISVKGILAGPVMIRFCPCGKVSLPKDRFRSCRRAASSRSNRFRKSG